MTGPQAVVLVEGASDAAALETLARRRGSSRTTVADGVVIVVLHGYTNLPAALRALDPVVPQRIAVLCDEGAAGWVARTLGPRMLDPRVLGPGLLGAASGPPRDGTTPVTVRVCRSDLEDEMIRALGAGRVQELVDAEGELASLRSMRCQPAQRERSAEQQLHRFLGTRARRKERYGAVLAGALDLTALPEPLHRVLDDAGL
ncbi:hypothetical protein [Pseudonocardia phyllosphaerae]|uniref:hypothetical protein n=1 Tax=Pseudonocardia phyllosphaerae TaxID=3390502 RepID=UPI00397E0A67